MIKAKFRDAVRSKSNIEPQNEVRCKILCHDLCVLIMAMHKLTVEKKFKKDYSKEVQLI
jgi:hypothetical protein